MYLFIHHFTIQDFEGVEMNPLVEREDGVTDGGVVGQSQVFLRRSRGRGWMTVPVSEDLQAILTSVLQCSELILRCEGKVLWRVINILHPIVLRHHIAFLRGYAQQVTARLIRCVLPGLADQFIYNILWYLHHLVVFEVASGLFIIYQVVDGGVTAADGA